MRTRTRSRTRARAPAPEAGERLPRERERARGRRGRRAPTSGSLRPRPATKTSGKVTESATEATMNGASATTSRPISRPDVVAVRVAQDAAATSAPATAKSPAVAATTRSASHEDASTWRATPAGVETEPRQRHRR